MKEELLVSAAYRSRMPKPSTLCGLVGKLWSEPSESSPSSSLYLSNQSRSTGSECEDSGSTGSPGLGWDGGGGIARGGSKSNMSSSGSGATSSGGAGCRGRGGGCWGGGGSSCSGGGDVIFFLADIKFGLALQFPILLRWRRRTRERSVMGYLYCVSEMREIRGKEMKQVVNCSNGNRGRENYVLTLIRLTYSHPIEKAMTCEYEWKMWDMIFFWFNRNKK